MRAHLVQMDMRWQDKAWNRQLARRLVEESSPEAGDLVVLPEMFDTGFSWDTSVTADDSGETLGFLRSLADQWGVCVVAGRTVRGPDGHCRNVATAVGPGDAAPGATTGPALAEYAKRHLFPLGEESRHIKAGDQAVTFRWPCDQHGMVFSLAICYDLRFPEVFRAGLAAGAEAFIVPSCWLAGRHAHWRPLLIARAIENQAYVLGVNRAGSDPYARYLGGTLGVSPRGEVLGELGELEGILSVDVDPSEVRRWRGVFPAWKDVPRG